MRYCKIVDGAIQKYNIPQNKTGLGAKSSLETYLAKGWYPIEDNTPSQLPEDKRRGQTHYEILADKVVVTCDIVDIPIEELQAKEQEAINIQARKYLADTDWYVVRYSETNEPIPEEILVKRQEARESIV